VIERSAQNSLQKTKFILEQANKEMCRVQILKLNVSNTILCALHYDMTEQRLKDMRFTWLPFHAGEQQISGPPRLVHLSTLTPAKVRK
jgi:hypothetical protein